MVKSRSFVTTKRPPRTVLQLDLIACSKRLGSWYRCCLSPMCGQPPQTLHLVRDSAFLCRPSKKIAKLVNPSSLSSLPTIILPTHHPPLYPPPLLIHHPNFFPPPLSSISILSQILLLQLLIHISHTNLSEEISIHESLFIMIMISHLFEWQIEELLFY